MHCNGKFIIEQNISDRKVAMHQISQQQFETLLSDQRLALQTRSTTIGKNHQQLHLVNKQGAIVASKIVNFNVQKKTAFVSNHTLN